MYIPSKNTGFFFLIKSFVNDKRISTFIKYWAAKLSFRSLLFMHMWLGGLVVSHSSSRVIAIFTQMDNVGIKDFEYRVIKCAFIIIVWSHFSPMCLKFSLSLSALYKPTFVKQFNSKCASRSLVQLCSLKANLFPWRGHTDIFTPWQTASLAF